MQLSNEALLTVNMSRDMNYAEETDGESALGEQKEKL